MRATGRNRDAMRRLRGSKIALGGVLLACALLTPTGVSATPASPVPRGGRTAAVHAICSGPNSAHVPCHFSTPSGNIRCVWTPVPDNVACVLRSSGRAYRLRPSGRAKAITLRLRRAGPTLPRNQQIVFPKSLSCHDTARTITCNQDFGTGAFTLAPKHSHGS
jgi:hypothetical protein